MEITVENYQQDLPIQLKSVQAIVSALVKLHCIHCDEVMIYFVDEPTICDLHQQHFQDPSPTDCISIQVDPPDSNPCFLGEIFVSPKAAINYCLEREKSVYKELTLYVVHGFLHLIGYDDLKKEDREKMRLAEKKSMDYLYESHKIISK